MATTAKATLAANTDVCGPVLIGPRRSGTFDIEVTGTITVAVQKRVGSTWYTVKKQDDSTDATFTADYSGKIDAAGDYRLLASGVSGGSAICRLRQA